MPARHKRPTAKPISKAERRDCLISEVADRISPSASDDQIDDEIRLFLFGSHSYAQHIAFYYFVSNPALQTTKLSKGQLKRLYKDIRTKREEVSRNRRS